MINSILNYIKTGNMKLALRLIKALYPWELKSLFEAIDREGLEDRVLSAVGAKFWAELLTKNKGV